MSDQIERTNGIDLEDIPRPSLVWRSTSMTNYTASRQCSRDLAITTTSRCAVRRVVVFSPESLQLAACSCELPGKGTRDQGLQEFWQEYRQSA